MKFAKQFFAPEVPSGAVSLLTEFQPEKQVSLELVAALISSPEIRPLIEAGKTDLHNIPPDRDAFHVLPWNGMLYIIGSNPRGAMQGVIEFIRRGGDADLEFTGVFSLKYRIHALLSQGVYKEHPDRETIRDCVKFLAMCGASHVAATNDFSGNRYKSFYNYVPSSIFPDCSQEETRKESCRILHDIIDAAKEFGLGVLFETIFMPVNSSKEALEKMFAPEVVSYVGSYQKWGLCGRHPKIREFYREVTEKFFREFPEIELLHYITLDAGGDFCLNPHCLRCLGASKADLHDEWSRFIYETASCFRPGLILLNDGFDWMRNNWGFRNMLLHQSSMPSGIGFCLAAGNDPATFENQLHSHLLETRKVTAEKGQVFLGREAFFCFDDSIVPRRRCIADYPFGVFDKIRRWVLAQADGYLDVRGRLFPNDFHFNASALRSALLNSFGEPEEIMKSAVCRLCGGTRIFGIWQKIRQAHRMLSNTFSFSSASLPPQYIPWFLGWAAPIPGSPMLEQPQTDNELSPAEANGWIYHDGSYPERMLTTGKGCSEASVLLDQAAEELRHIDGRGESSEFQTLAMPPGFQWDFREYLRRTSRYFEFIARCYRVIGAAFRLRGHYLKENPDSGLYCRKYKNLLLDYAEGTEALVDFFERNGDDFIYQEPCSEMRSSFSWQQLKDNGEKTRSFIQDSEI